MRWFRPGKVDTIKRPLVSYVDSKLYAVSTKLRFISNFDNKPDVLCFEFYVFGSVVCQHSLLYVTRLSEKTYKLTWYIKDAFYNCVKAIVSACLNKTLERNIFKYLLNFGILCETNVKDFIVFMRANTVYDCLED